MYLSIYMFNYIYMYIYIGDNIIVLLFMPILLIIFIPYYVNNLLCVGFCITKLVI